MPESSDPAKLEEKRKLEDFHRQERHDQVAYLLGDHKGRAFIWDLLADCYVLRQPFVPGGPEGERLTTLRLGRLDIGLRLMHEVNQHPELYELMRQEAAVRAE